MAPPASAMVDLPGMEERDGIRTPWGWLRGFAWFLLAWPVLSLMALDQFSGSDWDTILIAMLGPAAIGAVLLLIDRVLTRLFAVSIAAEGQTVPSTLRDVSNTALGLGILMGINIALVSFFEDENLFTRPDLDAGPMAAILLAAFTTTAVLFRLLHHLRRGPKRHEDLGEGWDESPVAMRAFGYLTLIPTLLVCTVMIDYTLRGKPDFGLTAWISLPLLLLLGLRSAMARAPRYWARNPWEAWLRGESLALPWWIVGLSLAAATSAMFIVLPFITPDDEMTLAGRIIAGVLLGPIGLVGLGFVAVGLWHGIPLQLRRWAAVRALLRDPSALAGWEIRITKGKTRGKTQGADETHVWIRLRSGKEVPFSIADRKDPLVVWLDMHAAR